MATSRKLLTLTALGATLFATSASALILPLTLGVDGGVTDVKYKGRSATGYFWAVNGNLKLNTFSSIYSGYGETTADIPDANGVDQNFTSTSIPLALQITLPIVLGDVYVRGGGNYYDNTYANESEDGWGLLGAVGISLAPAIGLVWRWKWVIRIAATQKPAPFLSVPDLTSNTKTDQKKRQNGAFSVFGAVISRRGGQGSFPPALCPYSVQAFWRSHCEDPPQSNHLARR